MKPEWHRILSLRSVKDKIGVAIDCDVAEPGAFPIIAELVREGIMVHIDRCYLRNMALINRGGIARIGINADIYQLTLKGIRLCNENNILPH